MSPQVRLAALRAAARTALLGSLGCACGQKAPALGANSDATPAPASCAAYLDALAVAKPGQLAPGDPLNDRHDVYGAFADVTARGSARTRECCSEQLLRDGSASKQRWECCSALGGEPPGTKGAACTPWGPPCPPPMA